MLGCCEASCQAVCTTVASWSAMILAFISEFASIFFLLDAGKICAVVSQVLRLTAFKMFFPQIFKGSFLHKMTKGIGCRLKKNKTQKNTEHHPPKILDWS